MFRCKLLRFPDGLTQLVSTPYAWMMSEPLNPTVSKKDQIIDAAVAEFQENGFAAANMDRVSARACVSKRTVYKYFESKEKLFQAIVVQLWERVSADMNVRYQKGMDVRSQLTLLAKAKGRVLTDPTVMATSRLVISEVLRSPELAGETQGKMELKSIFVDMLRDATKDGQLTVDNPEDAADEFLGLLKAKAFWPIVFGAPVVSEAEMAQIIDSTVEMMMCRYAAN